MTNKNSLYWGEWLLVAFMAALFLSLVFIAACFSIKIFFEKPASLEKNKKKIFIYVEGALDSAVLVESSPPISFKHILQKLSLKKNADLSYYSKRKKFTHSMSIFIPEKEEEKFDRSVRY